MAYTDILYQPADEGVGRLILNRPDKRNALAPSTLGELCAALDEARADDRVRVLVLTGAGKVFSAGGDLGQMAGGGPAVARPASLPDLFLRMARLGKPILAMVNGHALAGGLGLVVACDLALAADTAQFGTPEIGVGLWPMMIMAQIRRNVPRKKALEMMLLGDRMDAAEAARVGLVNRVVPAARLEEETMALARRLAALAPAARRLGLLGFYETEDMALEPALHHLAGQLLAVLATDDAREGLSAFLEKRPPRFTGR